MRASCGRGDPHRPGVSDVSVNLATSRATVNLDAVGAADPPLDDLARAVADAGYRLSIDGSAEAADSARDGEERDLRRRMTVAMVGGAAPATGELSRFTVDRWVAVHLVVPAGTVGGRERRCNSGPVGRSTWQVSPGCAGGSPTCTPSLRWAPAWPMDTAS